MMIALAASTVSRRGSAARRGLRQSRQQTAAVSQDRDDLIAQRDTARAHPASTLDNGTSSSDLHPGPAGRPAAEVPAEAAAPTGPAANGSHP